MIGSKYDPNVRVPFDQIAALESKARSSPGDLTDEELRLLRGIDIAFAEKAATDRAYAQRDERLATIQKAAAPTPSSTYATRAEVEAIAMAVVEGTVEALIKGIADVFRPKVKALEDRITQLETSHVVKSADGSFPTIQPVEMSRLMMRVAALEDRPAALRYTGIWDATRSYAKDECCTHGGGLWMARDHVPHGVKPGDGYMWQLAVKGR